MVKILRYEKTPEIKFLGFWVRIKKKQIKIRTFKFLNIFEVFTSK